MKNSFLRAAAICAPFFAAALLIFPAQAAPFVVNAPTPTAAYVGLPIEYSATFFSGGITVDRCVLSIDSVVNGDMTLSGTSLNGTAKRTATIATAGSHTVSVACYNTGTGSYVTHESIVTVTVSSDTTSPVVGTVTPLSANAGSPATFNALYSDTGSGVASCILHYGAVVGEREFYPMIIGAGASGSATVTLTPSTAGSFFAQAECTDVVGHSSLGPAVTIVVAATDTSSPIISSITPTTATRNVGTMIRAYFSDNVGVTGCTLTVDGISMGSITYTSSQAARSYTFSVARTSFATVACTDAAGNVGTLTQAITVSDTDISSPVVNPVTPTTAVKDSSTMIRADFTDNIGVTSCSLTIDGTSQGAMTLTSTQAAKSYTFSAVRTHIVTVTCLDFAGNSGSQSIVVDVTAPPAPAPDTTGPTIGSVSPITAVRGSTQTYTVAFLDANTVSGCVLHIQTVIGGSYNTYNMSMSSATSSNATYAWAYAATAPTGIYNMYATCTDASGNVGTGASTGITVSAASATDTSAPVTGFISYSPSDPTVGTNVTFTVTPTDNIGVTRCSLLINGTNPQPMIVVGSGYARSYTMPSTARTRYDAICYDAAGLYSGSNDVYITPSPAGTSDTTAPVIGTVSPSAATMDVPQTFSIGYSDVSNVTNCVLFVQQYSGTFNSYTMLRSGASTGNASYTYTFSSAGTAGTYGVYAQCTDQYGNLGANPTTYVSVSAPATTSPRDTTGPSISSVSPNAVVRGSTQTYTVSFADASPVASCTLHVQQGTRYANYEMSRMGASVGTASFAYTYWTSVAPGNYHMYATCADINGNTGSGPDTNISVNLTSTAPRTPATPPGGSYERQLIKLTCPDYEVPSDHLCKAVYYVSSDGKRHAFPNERAYLSWYGNFDNVYEMSSIASFPLGANVTYRPGIKLVKFTTLDRVYAVSRSGLLRWITSESAAQNLYGSNWNRQVDDLSDTLFTNYHFGTDINTASEFSPSNEAAASTLIDSNF
ncbi:MAG: hypothetical protein WCK01_03730 [Candidatus Uhrbacteria bacterium]